MNAASNAEDRALDASEAEMVKSTRAPAIGLQSADELKALAHRLRQAHSRAKDIAARQRREIRGKAAPRGVKSAKDNAGSVAKEQALFDAIHRIDEELARRDAIEMGAPTQADLTRRAYELKMSAEAAARPDPGRTASKGMRPTKRVEEFPGGTTRKEVGRVSQAGKVAQARRDSGKP